MVKRLQVKSQVLAGIVLVRLNGRVGLQCRLTMYCRSSVMLSQGGAVCTGTYFNKTLQLQRVILPEPLTQTTYWSNCHTSIMTPVLSHVVGHGPVWFWIHTWFPTTRSGSHLVCSVHCSVAFVCLFLTVVSLVVRVSHQVRLGM